MMSTLPSAYNGKRSSGQHHNNGPIKAGKKTIVDFANTTSIHGIAYIFNTTLLILERLIWLIVFGIFAVLAIFWSVEAYFQWQDFPVLTSVKTTGLPLHEVEYPAITICSHGLIEDVISNALNKQFNDFVKNSTGKDVADFTQQELDTLKKNYTQVLYPGAQAEPKNMVNVLTSDEPDETLSSQVLTDPKSACFNSTFTCSDPWMVPNTTNAFYLSYYYSCVANFTKGKFDENKCEANGGTKLYFSPYDWAGADVISVRDNLLLTGGVFDLVTTSEFWYGGIVKNRVPYSDDGVSMFEWDSSMELYFNNNSVDFEILDPHKDYCITFSLAMEDTNSSWPAYGPTTTESYTNYKFVPKVVDCDGNHEAYFICWKKPMDCSAIDGTSHGAAGRRKRSDTEPVEASLDKVFDPAKKLKYENIAKAAKVANEENFKKMNLEKSYKSLFEILWYTQLPCYDVANVTSTTPNKYGMLKSCMYRGVELPCSELFTTFPTDQGMCCTFNVRKADEMFKTSEYQKMVDFMQTRDKNMSFIDPKLTNVKWQDKDLVPQAGRKKGLRLILDAHSDHLSGGTVTEDFDGFYAIIDSNKQFPTVTRKTVLIRPGHENIVSMGATKVSATRHIKKLDKEKRVCLFGDEFEMNVHQEYTQANCLLECAMEYSISIMNLTDDKNNTDPCIPWYFPRNDTSGIRLCNPWEAQEFRVIMDNVPDRHCEYCLPDCSTTLYHATITAAPFRRCDFKNLGVSRLCNFGQKIHPPIWGQQVLDQYKKDLNLDSENLLPEYVTNDVESNTRQYADESKVGGKPVFTAKNEKSSSYDAYEKDIAMVTFFFESTTAFEYSRDERMTLIQYISQIGGLMGLCIGFSFISAVEIVYWFTIRYFRNL